MHENTNQNLCNYEVLKMCVKNKWNPWQISSKWEPEAAPKGAKASKTSSKRMWKLCFTDIMLKILNLLKHVFYCRNLLFFEGTAVRKMNKTWKTHAKNRCLKNVRKLLVIWSKNGPPKGYLKRSKLIFFVTLLHVMFDMLLRSFLGR